MQSAPDKSPEKTSSIVRGVRAMQRAPGASMINIPSLEPRNLSVGALTLRPQLRAEISLASVREDGEQAFTAPKLRGDEAAGVKNRSRRDSAKNPLLLRKPARGVARIVKRNRDKAIHNVSIEDRGNESGADTLNFVRAGLTAGKNGRFGGLDCKEFQGFDLFLHNFARARGGAACPDTHDQGIEPFTADVDDFLGCCFTVNLGVCRILELLRHEVGRILAYQLLGLINGPLHRSLPRSQHYLRAVRTQ